MVAGSTGGTNEPRVRHRAPADNDSAGPPARRNGDPVTDEVDLTIVTMVFDATDIERLLAVLAKYVVVSRGQTGCRNIDLAGSATVPGRFMLIEKWETPADQQRHFDSAEMIEMAKACQGILSAPPTIDLLEAISAHDLT